MRRGLWPFGERARASLASTLPAPKCACGHVWSPDGGHCREPRPADGSAKPADRPSKRLYRHRPCPAGRRRPRRWNVCPRARRCGCLPGAPCCAVSSRAGRPALATCGVPRTGLRDEGGPVLVAAHQGGQKILCRRQSVSGTSPASPPRSRAVWDGRRPLQPPLRRPGASACHGGRSASGSDGTVSLRSRTTAVLRGFRSRLARPQETAPEGEDAGMGPATPLGSERD